MELIAMDKAVPPHKVNTSIRELIRMGYRDNKASNSIQQKFPIREFNSNANQTQDWTAAPATTIISRKSLQTLRSTKTQVLHLYTTSF
jgi:hypothetical protein